MTKATPTALKLVKGNPGKRKSKINEASPPPSRPSVPENLTDVAKVEWGRVIERLFECGLMTDIDRPLLAAYCDAYADWVEASLQVQAEALLKPKYKGLLVETTNGNLIQNPMVRVKNKARADMLKAAIEFGMSPSARSRIDVQIGTKAPSTKAAATAGTAQDKFFRA